jgi:hypothetical protein
LSAAARPAWSCSGWPTPIRWLSRAGRVAPARCGRRVAGS